METPGECTRTRGHAGPCNGYPRAIVPGGYCYAPAAEKPPRHAFEVRILVGGDTWDYVIRTIRDLAEHIPDHGPECGLSSGGAGGSHSVDIFKRDIAPEAYHQELQEWHERQKECHKNGITTG